MNIKKRNNQPVIFFDGYCNLCNKAVQWIINQDPRGIFLLAPLNSHYAKEVIPETIQQNIDSLILVHNDEVFVKSTAVLKIAKILGGSLKLIFPLILIPPFIRDLFYDVIARYRYQWFGKRESCMVPTPDLQGRFLD